LLQSVSPHIPLLRSRSIVSH